jgi:CheY-like chemotaxis protein
VAMASVLGRPGVVCTSVQVTRANGTVEPERVVSYKHPDARRQKAVTALLKAGVIFTPAELEVIDTLQLCRQLRTLRIHRIFRLISW